MIYFYIISNIKNYISGNKEISRCIVKKVQVIDSAYYFDQYSRSKEKMYSTSISHLYKSKQ